MGHIDESLSLGFRIVVSLVYIICENAVMVSKTLNEDSGAENIIYLLTAIYSAELAEVTAMKIKSSVAAAPPLPNNAT